VKKIWSTSDICTYYGKSKAEVKRWRDNGLKHIMLSGAFYYDYRDIVEYLKD
jgi:hypothetical protein